MSHQYQEEKVKLTLFISDMILHAENPKGSTKRLLNQYINLPKLQDSRSAHEIQLYFYMLGMNNPKTLRK